jgi:hypothetical protein
MNIDLLDSEVMLIVDSLRKAASGRPDAGLAYVLASRIEATRLTAALAKRGTDPWPMAKDGGENTWGVLVDPRHRSDDADD